MHSLAKLFLQAVYVLYRTDAAPTIIDGDLCDFYDGHKIGSNMFSSEVIKKNQKPEQEIMSTPESLSRICDLKIPTPVREFLIDLLYRRNVSSGVDYQRATLFRSLAENGGYAIFCQQSERAQGMVKLKRCLWYFTEGGIPSNLESFKQPRKPNHPALWFNWPD